MRWNTVASEGLKGKPDSDIWNAARRDDRLLITQDLDSPTCGSSSLERIRGFCSCGCANRAPMRF
ncbi:MAG: DUF5615 family PIN-like protein [Burkholderiales bacterium]